MSKTKEIVSTAVAKLGDAKKAFEKADLVGKAQPDGAEMVSVFLPTTPNPTSGFFMMMRRDECIELDMSVDAALKYVVSMGVVAPVIDGRGRSSPATRTGPQPPMAE